MILETGDQENLKGLTEHPGFKILERLAKEMRDDLYKKFDHANFGEEKAQMDLALTQNMLNGANYLLDTAKSHTKVIVEKKID